MFHLNYIFFKNKYTLKFELVKTSNVKSLEYIMHMYFREIRHFKQTFNSDPCYVSILSSS